MEWRFGADMPVRLEVILNQIFNADYDDIPDGSIFVPKKDYESRNIQLTTPAYISQSSRRDAGDWTYYLELLLVKDLFDGWSVLDQDLLDRVTHYAIYDSLPDE
ncbi:hypothetical protein [Mycobacterium camsae]|uniref:hypothetical protein n=1 Tax=Mycobacterium gordonae TaxID=1778 RepID=UPI00197DA242|nr:hypothetical protein [Mycobacterium gordonae]